MLRTAIPRLVCSSATKSPLAQNQLLHFNTPLRPQTGRCLCHPFRHLNVTARRPASKYITPKVERRLEDISTRYSLVVEELVNEAATLSTERRTTLSRELSALEDASEASKEYRKVKQSLAEVEDLIADPNTDSELRQMAKDERREILDGMPAVEEKIIGALLPREPEDVGSAIMEIRAGAGGDEAALFAADMLRMYERFAFLQGWKFDIMTVSAGLEAGSNAGFKEAIVSIAGADVFGLLKFESGVHRVQRVPATETQGRVHTSTAQVALLPQVSEHQVKINPSDLRIDVYRSSGAGGQHVNKTESAVRITHYPTGVVVAIQDERSQHRNKEKAMSILYARVAELDRVQRRDERSRQRQSLIGKGERSEKIRTYNFAQNRVTDHRIGLTMHGLDKFLMGETLLDIINALKIQAKVEAMTEITQD